MNNAESIQEWFLFARSGFTIILLVLLVFFLSIFSFLNRKKMGAQTTNVVGSKWKLLQIILVFAFVVGLYDNHFHMEDGITQFYLHWNDGIAFDLIVLNYLHSLLINANAQHTQFPSNFFQPNKSLTRTYLPVYCI